MHHALILSVAAFGAGVLNTVAGGGSFLTLPAPKRCPFDSCAHWSS